MENAFNLYLIILFLKEIEEKDKNNKLKIFSKINKILKFS